jgi:hypothetical protein
MKINELRIGNFIQVPYGNEEPWIREVDYLSGDFVVTQNGRYCNDDEFDFAPLTEEWLLKFGFVKYDQMGDNSFWNYNLPNHRGWNLAIFNPGIYVSFGTLNWDNCPTIQYIHQLQNLYFCLTGQELTFK